MHCESVTVIFALYKCTYLPTYSMKDQLRKKKNEVKISETTTKRETRHAEMVFANVK